MGHFPETGNTKMLSHHDPGGPQCERAPALGTWDCI